VLNRGDHVGRFDDVTVKSIKALHVSCLGYNKWAFNTGDCLIEVTTLAGLEFNLF
jgi:hypothetical protein